MGCTTQLFEKVGPITIHLSYEQHYQGERPAISALLCEKGRDWVQTTTTMQILSLHAPPSSQLPGSHLEVMSACSSNSDRSYQVWMVIWWWQSRHSLNAVATSNNCWLASVSVQVKDTCMANRLACTDMCYLQSCSNQKQQEDEDDIVELGDSDDDND